MAEINGKYEEINNVNLLDYLIENKYRVDRVVIDYNGDIVKKSEFSKINIKNADKIEIVCCSNAVWTAATSINATLSAID